MKICPECPTTPLPFVMVALIASIIAFLTWLTLGLSFTDPLIRVGGSVAVFVAVGGTLLHYVVSCLRRHCQHQERFARAPRRPRASGGLGSSGV
jgi:hypothetical protein